MNSQDFQVYRQRLQKTQKQLSELLGTSLKAIQSFEQGWRNVPVHIERQMLFLLTLQKKSKNDARACWDVRNCTMETRRNCPAWELDAGNLCWFINGTICEGKPQSNWSAKIKRCRKCEVFKTNTGTVASRRKPG
jgi:DNA-binding XRE family transcriptional regulator